MRQRSLVAFSLALGLSACSAASSPDTGGGSTGGSSGGNAGGTGGSPSKDGTGGASSATGGSSGATGGSPGSSGEGGSSSPAGSGGVASTGGSSGSGGTTGSGGSSTDVAAPSDDGGSDAPPASGNACAGAKKCFDFEDQTAGGPPSSPDYKVETTGGTMTVDTTKAFSGSKSILIKTRGGTNFPGTNLVFSGIEKLLPANDLHGRVMMWMANTPGAAHWDSVLGSAAGGSNPTYILGGMYKNFMSVYHPGDVSVDSNTPFPTGTWACVQWQFSGKDGKSLHKMMLNGQVVDKGIKEGWRAPTFSQLKVGYRHFNTNVAVDVWLDDLAFGDQPIACPEKK
jgi:hypothetical protein